MRNKLNIKFGKVKSLGVDIIPTYPGSTNNALLLMEPCNSTIITNTCQFNFHLIVAEKKLKKSNDNSFHTATIIATIYVRGNGKVEKAGNQLFQLYKMA